ncbi:MAG: carboxyl-terminal processing protease [Solirubrobacteraceae bacterium]|jgi:carboxyl-terminal processing protease|nr:carboxyl-terminal processing protease [Solirubrobacteraceae bacterium]
MSQPSSRPRRVAALIATGLVLLVVGLWVGAHATWLPSPLGNSVVGDRQARLVHQVLDDIHAAYYRKVNRSDIANSGLAAMIGSLHDPFSHYFSPAEYKSLFGAPHLNGIGIDVVKAKQGLRVVDVFNGYPAAKAGLTPGDLIVAVGSQDLAGHSAGFAQKLIRGPAGTRVVLTVLIGKHRRVVNITREHIIVPVAADHIVNYHGVKLGYVQLTTFDQQSAGNQVRTDVHQLLGQGARGIILDLRENGGGLINEAIKTASIFIPSGTITTIAGRNTARQVFTATGHAISTKIPVVVLVDGQTASASEIVAAALQDDHRAKIVGTHTFGKGVFQDSFGLPGGGVLEIVAGYYYTPSGRNLGGGGVKQGAGVKPDIYAAEKPHSSADQQLQIALKTLAREVG